MHLVAALIVIALSSVRAISHEESGIRLLRRRLLYGYDVNARPVHNHLNRTEVFLAFRPVHITEVDENRGILVLEGWLDLTWSDDHLKWNPEKYYHLDHVHLSEDEVWTPHITVFEGRGSQLSPWHSKHVEVKSSGLVEWMPAATLEIFCGDFDYANYPKDTQTCSLTLGCWTQNLKNVHLNIKEINDSRELMFSSKNPRWRITNFTLVPDDKDYNSLDEAEEYTTVQFKIEIVRINVPHSVLGNVPDTVARVLILCMFWVTNATRKFILGCTSLLILSIISVGITVTLPSPAAATAALFEIRAALSVCITALVIEILISVFVDCTLDLPTWMEKLTESPVFRFISLCQVPKKSSNEDQQDTISSVSQRQIFCPIYAVIFDRLAFVIFAIILLSL